MFRFQRHIKEEKFLTFTEEKSINAEKLTRKWTVDRVESRVETERFLFKSFPQNLPGKCNFHGKLPLERSIKRDMIWSLTIEWTL